MRDYLFLRFKSILKKIEFFYFFLCYKLIFFMFLDHFDVLILKIILKKLKKYYFNIFLNKKYFKLQSLPYFHFQTSKLGSRTSWNC